MLIRKCKTNIETNFYLEFCLHIDIKDGTSTYKEVNIIKNQCTSSRYTYERFYLNVNNSNKTISSIYWSFSSNGGVYTWAHISVSCSFVNKQSYNIKFYPNHKTYVNDILCNVDNSNLHSSLINGGYIQNCNGTTQELIINDDSNKDCSISNVKFIKM